MSHRLLFDGQSEEPRIRYIGFDASPEYRIRKSNSRFSQHPDGGGSSYHYISPNTGLVSPREIVPRSRIVIDNNVLIDIVDRSDRELPRWIELRALRTQLGLVLDPAPAILEKVLSCKATLEYFDVEKIVSRYIKQIYDFSKSDLETTTAEMSRELVTFWRTYRDKWLYSYLCMLHVATTYYNPLVKNQSELECVSDYYEFMKTRLNCVSGTDLMFGVVFLGGKAEARALTKVLRLKLYDGDSSKVCRKTVLDACKNAAWDLFYYNYAQANGPVICSADLKFGNFVQLTNTVSSVNINGNRHSGLGLDYSLLHPDVAAWLKRDVTPASGFRRVFFGEAVSTGGRWKGVQEELEGLIYDLLPSSLSVSQTRQMVDRGSTVE